MRQDLVVPPHPNDHKPLWPVGAAAYFQVGGSAGGAWQGAAGRRAVPTPERLSSMHGEEMQGAGEHLEARGGACGAVACDGGCSHTLGTGERVDTELAKHKREVSHCVRDMPTHACTKTKPSR